MTRMRCAAMLSALSLASVALTVKGQNLALSRQALAAGQRSSGGSLAVSAVIGPLEGGATSAGAPLRVTGGFLAGATARAKGDFDDDGHVDLLLRRVGSGVDELEAWLMRGAQRVGPAAPVLPSPPSGWKIVGVDDFGGDEQSDLVLQDTQSGAIAFWILDGTVRPGAPVPLGNAVPLALNWELAATADFNRDGFTDLLWRNSTSLKLVVWTLEGTNRVGALTPNPALATDFNWQVVAALDYNGDALVDLLWYNATTGKIVLWFMDASLSRTSGNFTTPSNAADNSWRVVAGGDFGTGPPALFAGANDIVWQNSVSGRIVVWHMDFNRARSAGLFVDPAPDSSAWQVTGPR